MESLQISETMSLTTDHSASSYGIPVLVFAGKAYGPDDDLYMDWTPETDVFAPFVGGRAISRPDPLTAARRVADWAKTPESRQLPLVSAFLGDRYPL